MKFPENIQEIQKLKPDFMGFIFYKQSARYINNNLLSALPPFDRGIKKVGVFVKSPILKVIETVKKYQLDYVQLHGNESVEYVKALANLKIKIIKVFPITANFNWADINPYVRYVSYFLFDTASKNYGGSGLKFDWSQLKKYQEEIPFFLSGGIRLHDIQAIQLLQIQQLFGIDVNSGFELAPGLKNTELVKQMINQIRHESNI